MIISFVDHPLAKTNQSLHDIRLSIDQLNYAERDPKILVDDLTESHSPHSLTPRHHKSATMTHGGAKKRLDYDVHNNKQSNTSELFDRLSQPKSKTKKDKNKQPTAGVQGAWK
jgi:hypothetical protein